MRWKLPRLATTPSNCDSAVEINLIVDDLTADWARTSDEVNLRVWSRVEESQAMQSLVDLVLNTNQSFSEDCKTHSRTLVIFKI